MSLLRQFTTGAIFGSLALASLFLITPNQARASIVPGLCDLTQSATSGFVCYTGGVEQVNTGAFWVEGSNTPETFSSLSSAQTGSFIPGYQACSAALVTAGSCQNASDYLYNYYLSITGDEEVVGSQPSYITFYNIGGYLAGSAAADSTAQKGGVAVITNNMGSSAQTPAGTAVNPPDTNCTNPATCVIVNPNLWTISISAAPGVTLTGPETDDGIAFESSLGLNSLDYHFDAAWQAEQSCTPPGLGNCPVSGYVPDNGQAELAVPSPVPEPSSVLLLATGMLGVAFWGSRRSRRS